MLVETLLYVALVIGPAVIAYYTLFASRSRIDALYQEGVLLAKAGHFERARKILRKAHRRKPAHANVAFEYGNVLNRLGHTADAVAVWETVPENEKHQKLNYARGVLYHKLGKFGPAIRYFRAAIDDYRHIRGQRNLYWPARAWLVVSQYRSSGDQLAKELKDHLDVIDTQIVNLNRGVICLVGKKSEWCVSDDIFEEVRRQEAAFFLLDTLAHLYAQEERHLDAIEACCRAADYIQGPPVAAVLVTESYYLAFLRNLSTYLSGYLLNVDVKLRGKLATRVAGALARIETHNLEAGSCLADMTLLVRAFYTGAECVRPIQSGPFRLTYAVTLSDVNGLKGLRLSSPSFIVGEKEVDLGGTKKYELIEEVVLPQGLVLNERPYCFAETTSVGGKTAATTLFPTITWAGA